MTANLKRRVDNRPIRGGLYVSCAARGPNQFAEAESETAIIRDAPGDFPMVGFFANGAPNRDRICACTEVPALFLQSSAAVGATRSGEGPPNVLEASGVGAARLLLGILSGEDALRHLAPERDPQAPVRLRSAGAGIRATVLLQ